MLTQYFSWRWIFGINLPITAVSLYALVKLLPAREKRTALAKTARQKASIDWWGFILSCTVIISLVIALMQLPIWGALSAKFILLLLLALVSFFIFLRVEHRHVHPFINLKIFQNSYYRLGNVVMAVARAAAVLSVFLALFFQLGMGYSPLKAGVAMLPYRGCCKLNLYGTNFVKNSLKTVIY